MEINEGAKSPGVLGEFARIIREQLGDDNDLLKQCISDLHSYERQAHRNHFEARMEYIKQRNAIAQNQFNGLKDYGLQTLRWLFLLNAGAIGVILAYTGKLAVASTGLLTVSLIPFAAGCICVVMAGLFGFLNFSYFDAAQPSPEQLHLFMDPESKKWPAARFQSEHETGVEFHKRFGWRIRWTRIAAIVSGLFACLLFIVGVGLVCWVVSWAVGEPPKVP
ncbi:hypothetical protein [Rhodoplanes roseus]|uniref:hypothetical protein n=1 Tax=Rhodoplanes roseus TaxID=29409 RepID=UPI0011B4EADF|nr:hypothetical protein [Rhodoplanes roseus]